MHAFGIIGTSDDHDVRVQELTDHLAFDKELRVAEDNKFSVGHGVGQDALDLAGHPQRHCAVYHNNFGPSVARLFDVPHCLLQVPRVDSFLSSVAYQLGL